MWFLEWPRNLLAGIPLWVRPVPFLSLHCDCQVAIARARNKTYNGNSRHICLRHNNVKQLLGDGTDASKDAEPEVPQKLESLNFVRSERNLADPLTKPLGKKVVSQTSRGMGLMSILDVNSGGNPTYVNGDPMNRFLWVITNHLLDLVMHQSIVCPSLWCASANYNM